MNSEHKGVFLANCRKVAYKKSLNKASDITALTDWSDSQLDVLGDLMVKYNHVISINDPVDVKNSKFSTKIPNREFPELKEANDPKKACATSWVSAAIEVAEAALDYSVKLSAKQLFECLPKARGLDDGCSGIYPKVLMDYLLEVGLVEEDMFMGCDSLDELEHYAFFPKAAEPPNASGLMNLIAEGKPVFAMIAVDLKKLRYVKDMSKSNEYLKCGDYEPSLYGIVNGYSYDKDNMNNSWWEFTSRIVPEEEIIVKIPMSDNMENANYAGIATYAFTLTKADHITTGTPTPVPTAGTTPVPTDRTTPVPTDEPTPTPTVTADSWLPIYDPFIFGDNTNYADNSTCIDEIPSDIEILKLYLAIRDEYPQYALKNTRVLALAGLNKEAIELLEESLKKQEKSDSPIDLYFFSDYVGARYTNKELAEVIPSLSCYTHPSRMVIAGGNFNMQDLTNLFESILDYASDCDGFLNLEYLEISGHRIAVNETINRNEEKNAVLRYIDVLCRDERLFPALKTLNLNQNYYMLYNDGFDTDLSLRYLDNQCRRLVVTAKVYDEDIQEKYICTSNPDGTGSGHNYYTMDEYEQCKYTWNWEYKDIVSQSQGPYPKVGVNPSCSIRRLEEDSGSLYGPKSEFSLPPNSGVITYPVLWYPVYDPFILGDNTLNGIFNQCSREQNSYMTNLKKYLVERDAYPLGSLDKTRVLALMGMTLDAVNLFKESFSIHRTHADHPIDMYFYSDYIHNYILGSEVAVPLISLSQYTYPSRIVFSDGTFGMQDLLDILDWMVYNADKGYFKYLESLQITRHRLNHINSSDRNIIAFRIIERLRNMCSDDVNFHFLREVNFDNNAFHEYENGKSFQQDLKNACGPNTHPDLAFIRVPSWRSIRISANDYSSSSVVDNLAYICPAINVENPSLGYYDSNSLYEYYQCKQFWHWDLFGKNKDIGNGGPYPLMNDLSCRVTSE